MSSTLPRILIALLAAGLVDPIPVVAGHVKTGLSFHSEALSGELAYSIYLPEAALREGEEARRFPTLYLLHGFGASDRQWLEGGIEAALDRLIGSGEIRPLIAVMPDAGNSWYVDSAERSGPGNWETAIVRDLVEHVDRRWPSIPVGGASAVAGVSMGGYGALRLALFHPERFAAAGALAPALFSADDPPSGPSSPTDEVIEHWYGSIFGEPFDRHIFMRLHPRGKLAAVARRATAPSIFMAVGDDDYFHLYDGTLDLFQEMRRFGLRVELRVSDGGHDWPTWRSHLPEMLTFIDRALEKSTSR